ncbi:VIT family-domain-containing protein [Trametes gibbosa]|nr:VIT family-domain-containing protein [Trametes gibbosa]
MSLRASGMCCKELRRDDERTLIDPDVLPSLTASTVPLALTTALTSLGESNLVILCGILPCTGRDHCRYLCRVTSVRVVCSCNVEMEREVLTALAPMGVNETVSRQVVSCLCDVKFDASPRGRLGRVELQGMGGTREHCKRRDKAHCRGGGRGELQWARDVSLTTFVLGFREGMQDVSTARMDASACTIGLGYLIGALIPLMPYFFEPVMHVGLVCLTDLVLVIFCVVKAHITGAGAGSSLCWLCNGTSRATRAIGFLLAWESRSLPRY